MIDVVVARVFDLLTGRPLVIVSLAPVRWGAANERPATAHTHACPACYDREPCMMRCSTDEDPDNRKGPRIGAHALCSRCEPVVCHWCLGPRPCLCSVPVATKVQAAAGVAVIAGEQRTMSRDPLALPRSRRCPLGCTPYCRFATVRMVSGWTHVTPAPPGTCALVNPEVARRLRANAGRPT